jgi:hypothetical protein
VRQAEGKGNNSGWIWATVLPVLAIVLSAGWIHTELRDLAITVKGLDDAVHIIASGQGGDIQKLVDEVLKVAQARAESGNAESARNLIDTSNDLIAKEKEARKPVPEDFFKNVLPTYRTLATAQADERISNAALSGIVQLAEYRSAVSTTPATFHPKTTLNSTFAGSLEIGRDGRIHLSDALIVGEKGFANSPEGTVLDGMVLDNVVFQNAKINYNGGPVTLHNVWFINCQFQVSKTLSVERLLEAVIQQPSNLTIG